MSDYPVHVYIRNANRETIGSTSNWHALTVVARRNDVGNWTLVTSSPEDALLLSPVTNSAGKITSNRGVILRRENDFGNSETFMSGWLSKEPDIDHSGGQTTWTFTGYDDTHLLLRALCWPKPTAPVLEQTDTHDIRTGPASNRIRDYYIANVANRMGVDGAVGGNYVNLGPNRRSQARFKGLLEHAQDIAARHLNFQVRQRDGDRALFLYQWLPEDKRLEVQFSPALGTVQSWSRTSSESVVNRVIIGAGGQMELRNFRQYDNLDDQAAWGIVEQFKDRRDLSPDDETWEEQAEVDGLEFLEENRARSSFTIDINGSPSARPFVHYRPGDLARAYIDQDENSQPIGLVDDLIEQVEVTFSAEGEEGTVQLGVPDTDLDEQMARQIRRDARRIAHLETRE